MKKKKKKKIVRSNEEWNENHRYTFAATGVAAAELTDAGAGAREPNVYRIDKHVPQFIHSKETYIVPRSVKR